ncbi:MAG: arabinogalactan endo-beta-1,4-galactanase [Flavobacterium sp.]|jgi:arabinogalactan endo-1,4-beta-galactosidase|uniref:glycoside hydrolase family 53 protein n=1 Tax=Flavobacterium sp. TaxID=239 RepID=UPI0022CA4B57|nr:glycosyl hydrolase 53 family protein [Flavobacterium sp.]MCZ8168145.1 glycosyl hydrolase 53 family protein [Flavobacterium sp.]MCZ8296165.1 glycosyl hydrolase 53 family protein [Flavobacterium sp.]
MKKLLSLCSLIFLFSCSNSEENANPTPTPEPTFYRATDASFIPLIESEGTVYKNNGVAEDPIITLKNAGCNAIRIRLWHNPADGHSGFNEVKTFAQRIKQAGLKVWITVHYSDTWADPGHQTKPAAWQSMDFNSLKNAVISYTTQIVNEIQPDIIQIGNETNDGMLWPEGRLSTQENQYLQLVNAACGAVRSANPATKIMLHFAGLTGADWYFGKVAQVDYDYIGLSYYPIWHGKSLVDVQNKMNTLGNLHNKKVMLAETSYPFTLGFDDFTNNVVGLNNQLIPGFDATPNGQRGFFSAIKNMVNQSPVGIGFCYWGAEWVAFRGPTATNGSSWENQALWDFDQNALPAMSVFNAD